VLRVRCRKQTHDRASIALEVAEAEDQFVSAQTIHRTLQQVGLHGRRPKSLQTDC